MKQFNLIFKQYLQYYIYWLLALVVIAIFIPKPFIIGLIIGSFGSLINTYIFELYLSQAQKQETSQISTGGIWRFLVALVACIIWVYFKKPSEYYWCNDWFNDFILINHFSTISSQNVIQINE